jgi:dinuclear metal center YbgI/SA1388 family protein
MKISEILEPLEHFAPRAYQENYDNAGLITGNMNWESTGTIVSLDATEAVVDEAISKKCNLVIAHHPIVFSGLKKLSGDSYVEKAMIKAIKNDIAIYAIHTNLDNIYNGVNARICDTLGLINTKILQPKNGLLVKLFTYVPEKDLEKVRTALFEAGAGHIGNYDQVSFGWNGNGTYRPLPGADPYIGEVGKLSVEKEVKLEVILPAHIKNIVLKALMAAHPYEEVAYDVVYLDNDNQQVGSGKLGELREEKSEKDFLKELKEKFNLSVIRHTPLTGKKVKKVAVCGGSGSFLIGKAVAAGSRFLHYGRRKIP